MWAEFKSISTGLRGFSLGIPVFLPRQNRLSADYILAGGCASGSNMDRIAAARSAFHMLSGRSSRVALLAVLCKNKEPSEFTLLYKSQSCSQVSYLE